MTDNQPNTSPSGAGPLRGLRVIDFGQIVAGPYCTKMLGELGAEVIHIERLDGDVSRKAEIIGEDGISHYFRVLNPGKESITLDLKNEKDLATVKALIAGADIVVENFSPGAMSRLGLGYEDLNKINPALIYTSISCFGQTGPDSDRPGTDLIAQAATGFLKSYNTKDDPRMGGVVIADLQAAFFAVTGTLAALVERSRTGRGNHIDVSLYDALVAMMYTQLLDPDYYPDGKNNRHFEPFGRYSCDGGKDEIAITNVNNNEFNRLREALGNPESLADDEKFGTIRARVKNREELRVALETILNANTAEHWDQVFRERRVPASPVKTFREAMESEHFKARRCAIYTMNDRQKMVTNMPIQMTTMTRLEEHGPVPKLNEHGEALIAAMKDGTYYQREPWVENPEAAQIVGAGPSHERNRVEQAMHALGCDAPAGGLRASAVKRLIKLANWLAPEKPGQAL